MGLRLNSLNISTRSLGDVEPENQHWLNASVMPWDWGLLGKMPKNSTMRSSRKIWEIPAHELNWWFVRPRWMESALSWPGATVRVPMSEMRSAVLPLSRPLTCCRKLRFTDKMRFMKLPRIRAANASCWVVFWNRASKTVKQASTRRSRN